MMRPLIQRLAFVSLVFTFSTLTGCGGGGGSTSPGSSAPSAISVTDVTATSTQTSVGVSVWLNAASQSPISVRYTTLDGTALAGADYVATQGQLTFPAGSLAQTVTIPLVPGRSTSTTKMFHLQLDSATNSTIADGMAVITLSGDAALFNSPTFIPNWGDRGVFSDNVQCASCHKGTSTVMNFKGKDISPVTSWKHSVMAHSMDDPYFQAVVEEETHVFPHMKGFIEDTCLRCHAPMGHAHFHATSGSGDFYSFSSAIASNHAREGVGCTSCHQIKDVALGTVASMSGQFTLNTEQDRVGGKLPIYGPFANPLGQAMQNRTQYTPTHPAFGHMSESKVCATCHNLYTPTLGINGYPITIPGTTTAVQFAEQTPYWEWLNSDFGRNKGSATYKTCQSCHMAEPEPGYKTQITTQPTNAPQRSPFAMHDMLGGNTHLLEVLKNYREVLGIAGATTTAGFDAKIADTKAMLRKAAALEIQQASNNQGVLTIPVTITNLTGHKLPTSYPSRRMWLHLVVKDSTGAVIFESGAVDQTGRIKLDTQFTTTECLSIVKDRSKYDYSQCYEPHRDVISNPNQVAIYESVLGDENGDVTHVLLHARRYLKDNRIPPKGYLKSGLPANPAEPELKDADVIGVDLAKDVDFAAGFSGSGANGQDTVTYNVNVAGRSAPFSVQADLFYQSTRPSFVKGLHADQEITEDSYVRRFKSMYESVPPTPASIASVERTFN